MKTFTKQMLQILVLIAAMLACVLNLQAQNMSRYITMTVQNGQLIELDMKAATENTPVRIVSGSSVTDINVGINGTGFSNYTAAAGTMTVYGDITGFNCSGNSTKLTTLDVSNNTALTELECYNNQLTTLDVSNNTALTELECDRNQLTTLDVTNNTALTRLDCYGNQLTTLDVTNNTALTRLDCDANQLTTLDVTNNTALTTLGCSYNQLTTLDVSNNTALRYLDCIGNQLDACALDQMFRTLPERQASDYARVFIKNGTGTDPEADGCRTPIANAKNWKVMDFNYGNPREINNTTFTCQEVSIDDILTEHVIKLYPNPVNSELYIATDAEVRIIQVFNMNGVEVARKFESNRIDLNHLQPNTYIVRITTDRNSSNQFVVKQ